MNKFVQDCLQDERQSLQGDHRQKEYWKSSIHRDGGNLEMKKNWPRGKANEAEAREPAERSSRS